MFQIQINVSDRVTSGVKKYKPYNIPSTQKKTHLVSGTCASISTITTTAGAATAASAAMQQRRERKKRDSSVSKVQDVNLSGAGAEPPVSESSDQKQLNK